MNAKTTGTVAEDSLDELFDCLASGERRNLLGHLHDRRLDPIPKDELATMLAARKYDTSPEQVTSEERQRVLYTLHHVHLPKLETAGLITREADGNAVALSTHPAYQDATIREVIVDKGYKRKASLDALFRVLSDSRRRTLLDVLSDRYQTIQVQTLARDVAADEREIPPREISTEDIERILASLQHVHLPHLQRAGLLEYDIDEGTVTDEEHHSLRIPWIHTGLDPDFREILTNSPPGAEI